MEFNFYNMGFGLARFKGNFYLSSHVINSYFFFGPSNTIRLYIYIVIYFLLQVVRYIPYMFSIVGTV